MAQTAELKSLYDLEDELTALKSRVVAARAAVKGDPVEDYVFEGWDGEASLSDLFDGRDKLIVIHNMGTACRYCTMWADGVNALLPQLEQVAAVAMINHDPVERQKAVSDKRGWRFRMANAAGTSFTRDMGFVEPNGDGMLPGTSTFTMDDAGKVRRHAMAHFGPHDQFCPVYSFLELLPEDAEANFEPV